MIVIGVMLSIFQQFVGINWCCTTRRKCSKRWGPARISRVADHYCRSYQPHLHRSGNYAVDKFGRKPLQIIGALGMAIVCLASVPRFTLRHRVLWRYCDAVLCCRLCHVLGSGMLGTVSEIFPNAIRGKALAIAVAASGWRTTSSPGPSR